MPWTCQQCAGEVATDDPVCPTCAGVKSSWSLAAGTTRAFTTSARRFKLLRGVDSEPRDPENPDEAEPELVPAQAARVVELDVVERLLEAGLEPAPRDVLTVRLFPKGYADRTVTLAVEYGSGESAELELGPHGGAGQGDDDGDDAVDLSEEGGEEASVDVRIVFVCGTGARAGEPLPEPTDLHLVDVSEETEVGYALGVEVAALKKRAQALDLEPNPDSARRPCLALVEGGQPLADEAYRITFAGGERQGTTDAQGVLREGLPAGVERASLEVAGNTYSLALDRLEPLDGEGSVPGLQGRLRNLGYDPGPTDGDLGPRTRAALEAFQTERGLEATGALDAPTRAALVDAHGV